VKNLISQASSAFAEHSDDIVSGAFDAPLVTVIPASEAMIKMEREMRERVYPARAVVEIEAAGFDVLAGLLDTFLTALLEEHGSHKSRTILQLVSKHYLYSDRTPFPRPYDSIMAICEYVASMTDNYAVDLFRKLRGISLPNY
jgi:dGTPase